MLRNRFKRSEWHDVYHCVMILAVLLVNCVACDQAEAVFATLDPRALTDSITCESTDAWPNTVGCTVTTENWKRFFFLTVPDDITAPVPLVFNFHGATSNPKFQNDNYLGPAKALDSGFLLATPGGFGTVPGTGAGNGVWNGGDCCGPWDDVAFVETTMDFLVVEYDADPKRIYAAGMSNGGILSYRLACELSDRIAAIASVGGSDLTDSCSPTEPVAILEIHGNADNVVPYLGGVPYDSYEFWNGVDFSSVSESTYPWVTRNGCSDVIETTYAHGEVTCVEHIECDGDNAVEVCTIDGGGHTWPGSALDLGVSGKTTQDINANDYLWEFFQRHTKK